MLKEGYEESLNAAKSKLELLSPQDVVYNTGVIFNGTTYEIPWFGNLTPLDSGSIEERIIWHHYLIANGPKLPRDRYITYKQVPGAIIYNDNFIKRAVNPMVKVFGNNIQKFLEKGKLLGGQQVKHGHMAFTLHPLPYIPITYILWEGDDEMDATGNILFDEGAIEWFCAEDLVVLAGLPVYKLMKM